MPEKVTFMVLDPVGQPLFGESPQVLVHRKRTGEALPLPDVVEVGGGLYEFEIDPEVDGPSAYLIDCTNNASPRYLFGSVGKLVAFAMFNSGVPSSTTVPSFLLWTDGTGSPPPVPEISNLTGGLFGFWSDLPPNKYVRYVAGDADHKWWGSLMSSGVFDPSPVPGTELAVTQQVSVKVFYSKTCIITAKYSGLDGAEEVVWDGAAASPNYLVESSAVSDGRQYTILRKGGWPSAPTIRVTTSDTNGRIHWGNQPLVYGGGGTAVDLGYSLLLDFHQNPPLTVGELFRQLSYHELHDLKVAQDGIGSLKTERHNQVIHLANEGLKRLHQRFELFGASQQFDVPVDGLEVPLSALAIQVVSILLEDGSSLAFKTHPVPGEVFVYNRRLHFPKAKCSYRAQVTWQKRHPILRYSTGPLDLEQPIYLSGEMWAALRAYIAAEVYGSMSAPDAAINAAKYWGKYEAVCAEMEATGGTVQGMLDKQVFHERGFV